MIIGIIQARLTSKRFRNKIFYKINGVRVIDWIIIRVRKAKLLDKIIFAIPKNKQNHKLKKYLIKKKLNIYEGSENDVLSRYAAIIKKEKAKDIVRICADNPFICPYEIDNLIKFYKNNNCDYAYNHIPKNNLYPDGIGAEIANANKILRYSKYKLNKNLREHIFSYINENPNKYKIKTFDPKDKNLHKPHLKLDIDYKKQFEFFKKKKILPNMNIKNILKKL